MIYSVVKYTFLYLTVTILTILRNNLWQGWQTFMDQFEFFSKEMFHKDMFYQIMFEKIFFNLFLFWNFSTPR